MSAIAEEQGLPDTRLDHWLLFNNPYPRTYKYFPLLHHWKMANRRCNFTDTERETLLRLLEIVKDLDHKLDYVIETQKDLYYRMKTEDWDDEQGPAEQ